MKSSLFAAPSLRLRGGKEPKHVVELRELSRQLHRVRAERPGLAPLLWRIEQRRQLAFQHPGRVADLLLRSMVTRGYASTASGAGVLGLSGRSPRARAARGPRNGRAEGVSAAHYPADLPEATWERCAQVLDRYDVQRLLRKRWS